MKNIVNITGGEKNFLFSDKSGFVGGGISLERKRLFKETLKTEVEKTQAVNKTGEEKIKYIQKQIEQNRLNEKIKKDIKPELGLIAKEYKNIKNSSLSFRGFLETFYNKDEKGNILIGKPRKGEEGSSLKKIQNLLIGKNSTDNKNEKPLRQLIEKLNTKISTNYKNNDISMSYEDVADIEKHSVESRESQSSILNSIIDVAKSVGNGNLLESEMGIIVTGILGVLGFKKAPVLTGWITAIFAGGFLLNKSTGGKFLSEFGKVSQEELEKIKLTDYQELSQETYQINTKQILILSKIEELKTPDFKLDTNITNLKKAARGEGEELKFNNKPEGFGFSNQDYAIVVLKILAKQGGYNFRKNEGIEKINDYYFNEGQKEFNSKNSLDQMSKYIFLQTSTEYKSSIIEWAEQHIDNGTDAIYQEAIEQGLVDAWKELKNEMGEIWTNSTMIKYENGKWIIFDKNGGEGSKSIITESMYASGRMIGLTLKLGAETISWTFGGDSPVAKLNTWLKGEQGEESSK